MVLPVTDQTLTLKRESHVPGMEEGILAYSCRQGSQLVQPHPVLASEASVKCPRPEAVSSQIFTPGSRLGCKHTSQAE